MSLTPRFFKAPIAILAEPPVASIGSTTKHSRSATSLGILQKYSWGSNVSSSRYIPMTPTLAEGIISITPLSIPIPARKIGTIVIFLPAISFCVVLPIGVSISTSFSGKSLVISYVINPPISPTI